MVTEKDIGKQVRTRTSGLIWTLDAIGASGDAYAIRNNGSVCWRGRAHALVLCEDPAKPPSDEEITRAREVLAQVAYAREVLKRANAQQDAEARHAATHPQRVTQA